MQLIPILFVFLLAFLRSMLRILVTANVVSSSPILVTLMMETSRSSEIFVLTRAKRRHIREDGILLILTLFFVPTLLKTHCGQWPSDTIYAWKLCDSLNKCWWLWWKPGPQKVR
jgi:hypothetical protein